MKNTKIKRLLLAVFVIVAVCMLSLTAFASAEKCTCEDDTTVYEGAIIEPTCETEGYTELLCSVCNKLVAVKDKKDPYNHSYGDMQYEQIVAAEGFYGYRECTRTGCSVRHYDYATDTEKAVYYKVEFVNPWATDSYDKTIGYTKVVATYKEETVFESYVKDGKITEDKKPSIKYIREKDKAFGRYNFKGWTAAKTDSSPSVEAINFDSFEVTGNTKLYAYFLGEAVYPKVVFYSEKGKAISDAIEIPYGGGVDDTKYRAKAKKAEDVAYEYAFSGWDKDLTAIYSDVQIIAQYIPIAQVYNFRIPGLVNLGNGQWKYDSAIKESYVNVNLSYGFQENVNTISAIKNVSQEKDATYEYLWTGKWQLKNVKGVYVDPTNITLPETTNPNVEYIELEPVFARNLRVYTIKIHLAFIDDPTTTKDDYYRLYATELYTGDGRAPMVLVKNSSGQFINTGEAVYDATTKSLVYTCNVNYSTDYIITATTPDYRFTGTATSKYWFTGNNDGATQVTLSLNYQEPEPCNCICHNSIFRGIWASCLNIIYSIFGKKVVCCDDMYATLNDLLAYTAKS